MLVLKIIESLIGPIGKNTSRVDSINSFYSTKSGPQVFAG